MPVPNDGQTVTASWNALVNAKPEDNIFPEFWTLNRMKKSSAFKSVDGGDLATASIMYAANGTAQWYSDMEALSTTRQDVFDRVEVSWKECAVTVAQSELENAINQGSAKKFDLLDEKLTNAKMSLDDLVSAAIHSDGTGSGSKEFGGLQHIIATAPTSGTVHGINRANFSFFRNQQASAAKTTSAFDNLRATWRSIYNLCSNGYSGKHPKYITTTRTVFEGFEGLLLANERFTSKESGDGGFENDVLKFKGAQVSYDNDCAAGNAYFWHPDFLKLLYLKGHWYKASPGVEPANQTAKVYKFHSIGNLMTTNARMLGVASGTT